MAEREVLNCPFCGAEASADGTVTYSETMADKQGWGQTTFFYCNCPSCGVNNLGLVGYRTRSQAVAAWNRRATEEI